MTYLDTCKDLGVMFREVSAHTNTEWLGPSHTSSGCHTVTRASQLNAMSHRTSLKTEACWFSAYRNGTLMQTN